MGEAGPSATGDESHTHLWARQSVGNQPYMPNPMDPESRSRGRVRRDCISQSVERDPVAQSDPDCARWKIIALSTLVGGCNYSFQRR